MRPRKVVECSMMVLPPAADCCQECAHKHPPELPHNPQSLFYQVRYKMEHGREATWADAMAHCTPKMQSLWRDQLALKGIDINGARLAPQGV